MLERRLLRAEKTRACSSGWRACRAPSRAVRPSPPSALRRAHPAVPAGRWQLALARFQSALDGYKATPQVLDRAGFAAAERDFERAGELSPELAGGAQGALAYRAMCRLARGWCAFQAGELTAARSEFLGMNELFARAIEYSLPGELESGIQPVPRRRLLQRPARRPGGGRDLRDCTGSSRTTRRGPTRRASPARCGVRPESRPASPAARRRAARSTRRRWRSCAPSPESGPLPRARRRNGAPSPRRRRNASSARGP